MKHDWGLPMDPSQKAEIDQLEASELKKGHIGFWCGAWYSCRCRTIFCEHCDKNVANGECKGESDGPWKVMEYDLPAM